MRIVKSAAAEGGRPTAGEELEQINAFARTKLTENEVYTFSVLLCDNEVDRDFERFSESTLAELRELFEGKTGITDHNWSSGGQKARIYRTELITDAEKKNTLGMPYMYLKGYAYMLRTESNSELIAEIEGGIKKEASVGCSIAESICSVCGERIGQGGCSHIKGRQYAGRLCYAELKGAVDAYEWSFVAVPAQKNAGVIKRFGGFAGLKSFVHSEEGACFQAEFEQLRVDAAVGRKYRQELKNEVLRLGLICDEDIHRALTGSVEHMDADELEQLKQAFGKQLEKRFPPVTQLPGRSETVKFDGSGYMV